ncbi:hypothetical protein [Runella sp. SP2]|uniref:hypothetical protein n=1 Tax=Runella sp. SP2 TaxID=2268026 RepID=UPI000F091C40|nr:hypothetical protein [Runella sp. SP2]AYQ32101.1 hypothetical protein DTQ70_07890 [Runella sp. SP2]
MRNLLTSILLTGLFSACLQDNKKSFWESKDAYFGQKLPGDTPEIFAPKMLIDSGIVLGTVSFSADGKAFYYTQAKGWYASEGSKTLQKVYKNGKWQTPTVLFEQVVNPTISPDDSKMYFGGEGSKVRLSNRVNGQWTTPKVIHEKNYGLYNWYPTNNTNIFYVASNAHQGSKKDYSTYDFCKMVVSETDTTISSLGKPLNTSGFDGDFYIAPDESYLIISAKETPTYECELWISFRKTDKTWSEPLSLGDAINKGAAHRFGQYVTPDGRFLIYTKGTSDKDCNFYWVRFDGLLERLKKKAGV